MPRTKAVVFSEKEARAAVEKLIEGLPNITSVEDIDESRFALENDGARSHTLMVEETPPAFMEDKWLKKMLKLKNLEATGLHMDLVARLEKADADGLFGNAPTKAKPVVSSSSPKKAKPKSE